MMSKPITALIAEDEPLLAQHLRQELALLWPDLQITAHAADGTSALQQALQHLPNLVFLDIRMPGLSGLEVAHALAEDWPDDHTLPHIVFVTAYDQYALQAFDAQALDYLLKPVQRARLARTVERLQLALSAPADLSHSAQAASAQQLSTSLNQIEQALAKQISPNASLQAVSQATPKLQAIQASVGTVLHRVPVADVLFFAAADKYVRVVTQEREYLIRTPIKALLPQLDADQFWQIHRSTVVQASAIAQASRDAQGKIWLRLKHHPEPLVVSRLHTDLFKAM